MRPRINQVFLSKTSAAVKELRERLGVTQQQFAHDVGAAINSIARYETGRSPKGRMLTKLSDLASYRGHHDLSLIFTKALADDMGVELPTFTDDDLDFATLRLMKSNPEEFKKELAAWNKIAEKTKVALLIDRSAQSAGNAARNIATKLARAGFSKKSIDRLLGMKTPETFWVRIAAEKKATEDLHSVPKRIANIPHKKAGK